MTTRPNLTALPHLTNPTPGETLVIVQDSAVNQYITVAQARDLLSSGPSGPVGPLGIQGAQGVQGVQGVQGRQGVQGDLGFQGVQGHQGLQGLQG